MAPGLNMYLLDDADQGGVILICKSFLNQTPNVSGQVMTVLMRAYYVW